MTTPGVPNPPWVTVGGDIPPIHPYLGEGSSPQSFWGGGVVIHSATLGCPPPHFATDLLRYILFFFFFFTFLMRFLPQIPMAEWGGGEGRKKMGVLVTPTFPPPPP